MSCIEEQLEEGSGQSSIDRISTPNDWLVPKKGVYKKLRRHAYVPELSRASLPRGIY